MCRRELFKAPYKPDTVTKLRARLEAFDAFYEGNIYCARSAQVLHLRDELWKISSSTEIVLAELYTARIEALGRVCRFDMNLRLAASDLALESFNSQTAGDDNRVAIAEQQMDALGRLITQFRDASHQAQQAVFDARERAFGELERLVAERERAVAQREQDVAEREQEVAERESLLRG